MLVLMSEAQSTSDQLEDGWSWSICWSNSCSTSQEYVLSLDTETDVVQHANKVCLGAASAVKFDVQHTRC